MVNNTTTHLLSPRPYPATLSLVIPIYNEESVIPHLRAALDAFRTTLPCSLDLVLVNDGSCDRTIIHLYEWATADPSVTVLHLSRNFGHQLAVTAGLDHATGDAIVIIDADLQDPLEVIPAMLERYSEGYDVVYGKRDARAGESLYKRFTAWAFYRIMRAFVYKKLPADVGDFRLLSRPVLDALKQMREVHRFLRGMVTWVGFPQTDVTYQRHPRVAGSTKYPLRKMLAFSWTATTSFSIIPLRLSILVGVLIGLLGIEEGLRAVLAYWMGWYTAPGWRSLMVVISLIGSAMLTCIGILGEYVGKLYEQAKGRPLYIVARTFSSQMEPESQHKPTAAAMRSQ